ncbi:unnamed protein product [Choristocarpus tenellus]
MGPLYWLIWVVGLTTASGYLVIPQVAQGGATLGKSTGTQARVVHKYIGKRPLRGTSWVMTSDTTSTGATVVECDDTIGPSGVEGTRRFYEDWKWRGHNINYRVEGPEDAPPVLLIHGFGASVGHFRKNIPVLVSEGYRVYAIDLLGFGASDKPKHVEYSLELWLELLLCFVDDMSANKGDKWIFMGNSIGGLLTLMITEALQRDERVRGSVLFNTAGGLVSFRKSELPVYLLPVMWFFNNVVGVLVANLSTAPDTVANVVETPDPTFRSVS